MIMTISRQGGRRYSQFGSTPSIGARWLPNGGGAAVVPPFISGVVNFDLPERDLCYELPERVLSFDLPRTKPTYDLGTR